MHGHHPHGYPPPRKSPMGLLIVVAVVLIAGAAYVQDKPSPRLPGGGTGKGGNPVAAVSAGQIPAQLGTAALTGVQALIAGIDWAAIRATLGSIGQGLGRLLESRTIDHSPKRKKGKGKAAAKRGAVSWGDVNVRPGSSAALKLCVKAARSAGFKGERLVTAVKVAMAESRCSFGARCKDCITGYTEDSRCAFQVNVNAHPQFRGNAIYRPEVCARAAYQISGGGSNWRPWTTYRRGTHEQFDRVVRRAVRG